MDSQIPNSILYERRSLSDMLQGVHDTIVVLQLEKDKIARLHNYNTYNMFVFQQLDQLRNNIYQLQEEINVLRKKGL